MWYILIFTLYASVCISDVTAAMQQTAYMTGEGNSSLMVCAILRETTERSVVITLQTVDGTAQSRF